MPDHFRYKTSGQLWSTEKDLVQNTWPTKMFQTFSLVLSKVTIQSDAANITILLFYSSSAFISLGTLCHQWVPLSKQPNHSRLSNKDKGIGAVREEIIPPDYIWSLPKIKLTMHINFCSMVSGSQTQKPKT